MEIKYECEMKRTLAYWQRMKTDAQFMSDEIFKERLFISLQDFYYVECFYGTRSNLCPDSFEAHQPMVVAFCSRMGQQISRLAIFDPITKGPNSAKHPMLMGKEVPSAGKECYRLMRNEIGVVVPIENRFVFLKKKAFEDLRSALKTKLVEIDEEVIKVERDYSLLCKEKKNSTPIKRDVQQEAEYEKSRKLRECLIAKNPKVQMCDFPLDSSTLQVLKLCSNRDETNERDTLLSLASSHKLFDPDVFGLRFEKNNLKHVNNTWYILLHQGYLCGLVALSPKIDGYSVETRKNWFPKHRGHPCHSFDHFRRIDYHDFGDDKVWNGDQDSKKQKSEVQTAIAQNLEKERQQRKDARVELKEEEVTSLKRKIQCTSYEVQTNQSSGEKKCAGCGVLAKSDWKPNQEYCTGNKDCKRVRNNRAKAKRRVKQKPKP